MLTPQQVADKWARNMGNASESIKAGVQQVTESPMAKAAAQADRYVQGVQQAVATGKFQNSLMAVPLETWKQAVISGIPNITAGVNKAKPKMVQFLSTFLPHVESVRARVRAMPKGGLEAGIARMTEMVRGIAQYRKG